MKTEVPGFLLGIIIAVSRTLPPRVVHDGRPSGPAALLGLSWRMARPGG